MRPDFITVAMLLVCSCLASSDGQYIDEDI
jgi:hypothetical protein